MDGPRAVGEDDPCSGKTYSIADLARLFDAQRTCTKLWQKCRESHQGLERRDGTETDDILLAYRLHSVSGLHVQLGFHVQQSIDHGLLDRFVQSTDHEFA